MRSIKRGEWGKETSIALPSKSTVQKSYTMGHVGVFIGTCAPSPETSHLCYNILEKRTDGWAIEILEELRQFVVILTRSMQFLWFGFLICVAFPQTARLLWLLFSHKPAMLFSSLCRSKLDHSEFLG